MNSGFDNPQFNAAIELINDSWHLKSDLVAAPVMQTFSLADAQPQDVQVVRTLKGNRLTFPTAVSDQGLSFAADKLFQGICAGDFTGDGNENVQVYYPHEREGKLAGKTVFTMKLDDARKLARTCFEAVGAPKDLFKDALRGKRNNALFGDSVKVHERDIIHSL